MERNLDKLPLNGVKSKEYYYIYQSKFGPGAVIVTDIGVKHLLLPEERTVMLLENISKLTAGERRRPGPLAPLLSAYFAGERLDLRAPLDLNGYSDFTKRVYRVTVGIGYGERLTYGEVADMAGSPRGQRAVGAALAKNRLPVFIPCHRVVKADGRLGGWSGPPGWKERLLALERK